MHLITPGEDGGGMSEGEYLPAFVATWLCSSDGGWVCKRA